MYVNPKDCELYYCTQVGGQYFHGIVHQRGYGIFGDIGRLLSPLAVRASRYLGKKILQTGQNVLSDVSSGTSFRDSAKNRFRETTKNIKDDIFRQLQRGKGIKKNEREKHSRRKQNVVKQRSKTSFHK